MTRTFVYITFLKTSKGIFSWTIGPTWTDMGRVDVDGRNAPLENYVIRYHHTACSAKNVIFSTSRYTQR